MFVKQRKNSCHTVVFSRPTASDYLFLNQDVEIDNNVFWQMVVLLAVWVTSLIIHNVYLQLSCTIV